MSEAAVEQQPQKTHPTNRLADKLKLRKAYVRGEGSLETLCNKHHVSYQTAVVWFKAEKWSKLKADYDKRELLKLIGGEPEEQHRTSSSSSITQRQLDQVNEAILASDNALEISKLTRAKLDLQEALWIERNGFKPGTERPKRQRDRRGSLDAPQEPIEPPDTPLQVGPTTEPQNQVTDTGA